MPWFTGDLKKILCAMCTPSEPGSHSREFFSSPWSVSLRTGPLGTEMVPFNHTQVGVSDRHRSNNDWKQKPKDWMGENVCTWVCAWVCSHQWPCGWPSEQTLAWPSALNLTHMDPAPPVPSWGPQGRHVLLYISWSRLSYKTLGKCLLHLQLVN